MYKITVGTKTMVGTNEDAWRTNSYIWFETGKKNEYGACFTGSRKVGPNSYAPQSGMNEHGLVYSRLASYHPIKSNWIGKKKKVIHRPDDFLKHILHTCKNVQEVHDLLKHSDHSIYIDDVFIFVEESGRYLIVEPYSMEFGNGANYVLSNFCPSITSETKRRKLKRYEAGAAILSKASDTSLQFCTSLSDAMHVCREKIGDGTLLTGIWDSEHRLVNLFFYHDYSKSVSFNLAEELAKGDHSIDITTLFPTNIEFEQLKTYITPFNHSGLRIGMAFMGLFFLFSSILFAFNAIRKKQRYQMFKGFISVLCLMMFCYLFILTTNIDVFYFSSPFVHFNSTLISAFSYAPLVLLGGLVPSLMLNYKILTTNEWGRFWKLLLTVNSVFFLIFAILFIYWDLYSVF